MWRHPLKTGLIVSSCIFRFVFILLIMESPFFKLQTLSFPLRINDVLSRHYYRHISTVTFVISVCLNDRSILLPLFSFHVSTNITSTFSPLFYSKVEGVSLHFSIIYFHLIELFIVVSVR